MNEFCLYNCFAQGGPEDGADPKTVEPVPPVATPARSDALPLEVVLVPDEETQEPTAPKPETKPSESIETLQNGGGPNDADQTGVTKRDASPPVEPEPDDSVDRKARPRFDVHATCVHACGCTDRPS